MNEPLPVTDEDRVFAWHDFYDFDSGIFAITMREPDPANAGDAVTLDALTRVLECDRERVANRSAE